MGGDIWVDDKYEKGSTFCFNVILKRSEDEIKENSITINKNLEDKNSDKLVLLVEDDKINQKVAELILKNRKLQIVTAENGDQKVYLLNVKRKNEGPTTTIGELLSIIDGTSASVINIDINDTNTTLTDDILNSIKDKKKNILINQYDSNKNILYKWEINGSNVTDSTPINTLISFDSKDKDLIGSLTNYADNLYLNFAYLGSLPKDTFISINVANKYKDGSKVKLYYFKCMGLNKHIGLIRKLETRVETRGRGHRLRPFVFK
jgi:CheY-like chemotaxis protein